MGEEAKAKKERTEGRGKRQAEMQEGQHTGGRAEHWVQTEGEERVEREGT